jgi:hypothetical protein
MQAISSGKWAAVRSCGPSGCRMLPAVVSILAMNPIGISAVIREKPRIGVWSIRRCVGPSPVVCPRLSHALWFPLSIGSILLHTLPCKPRTCRLHHSAFALLTILSLPISTLVVLIIRPGPRDRPLGRMFAAAECDICNTWKKLTLVFGCVPHLYRLGLHQGNHHRQNCYDPAASIHRQSPAGNIFSACRDPRRAYKPL